MKTRFEKQEDKGLWTKKENGGESWCLGNRNCGGKTKGRMRIRMYEAQEDKEFRGEGERKMKNRVKEERLGTVRLNEGSKVLERFT